MSPAVKIRKVAKKVSKQPRSRPSSAAVGSHEDADFIFGRLSGSLFYTPQRVGMPSAWWAHVPFAFWLMSACRPQLFVELGAHYGVSYSAFCEANLIEKLGAKCIAIDTWQGDEHAGFYDNSVFDEFNDFNSRRYGKFSTLIRSTFQDALPSVPNGTVDLLHIDGRHRYDDVRSDFQSWLPKLSDRAVILFHDTNVREGDFGVWKFFSELAKKFPSFEFLHGYGLGVICVGKNPPADVVRLCTLNGSEEGEIIRHRFNQLGALWSVPFSQMPVSDPFALLLAPSLKAYKDRAAAELKLQLVEKNDVTVDSEIVAEKKYGTAFSDSDRALCRSIRIERFKTGRQTLGI